MTNQAFIFANGFQRGGTNILVNLLASHPQVHWVQETHEVFYGDKWSSPIEKLSRRTLYLPIYLATGREIFRVTSIEEREPLSNRMAAYLDWILNHTAQKRIKQGYQNVNADSEEIRHEEIRPLYKNVNGMVASSRLLHAMYPEATFIGLVRNGMALCESWLRRGWSIEQAGKMYNQVCRQMIRDAERIPNYHLLRFEDILECPEETIQKIYSWAGLDYSAQMKFRLQAKKSMGKDGQRSYLFGGGEDRDVHWMSTQELRTHLRRDVNENQIAQLSEQTRETFLETIREPMVYFNYL